MDRKEDVRQVRQSVIGVVHRLNWRSGGVTRNHEIPYNCC